MLRVKSLITLALTGTICYLAIKQNAVISSEVFVGIVSSVITYYFTKDTKSKITSDSSHENHVDDFEDGSDENAEK